MTPDPQPQATPVVEQEPVVTYQAVAVVIALALGAVGVVVDPGSVALAIGAVVAVVAQVVAAVKARSKVTPVSNPNL